MLKELISWVENRPRFKDKTSLEKLKNCALALGNPQDNFKAIHITGTNGKGSTAQFIYSILKKEKTVGLFISPYILKFNERIQVNGMMITDKELLEYLTFMKNFILEYEKKTNESFTFFEIMTLMAFKYFSDKKVEYAIIEAGIGGKLDSTNIILPVLSIITSVGKDHEKQLGNTLESILDNKLGIVKESVPLITAVTGFDEYIKKYVKTLNTDVTFLDLNEINIINSYPLKFIFKGETYMPKLEGIYQTKNASLAIMAVNYLLPNLSKETIKKGINEAFNPGRFEIIKTSPYIILDGAHNYDGTKALVNSVLNIFPNKKIKVLFSAMQDKEYVKMLEELEKLTKEITITRLDYHRVFDIDNLNYHKIKDPIEAYNTLLNNLKEEEVFLVTGSLYFVSFIRNYLNL